MVESSNILKVSLLDFTARTQINDCDGQSKEFVFCFSFPRKLFPSTQIISILITLHNPSAQLFGHILTTMDDPHKPQTSSASSSSPSKTTTFKPRRHVRAPKRRRTRQTFQTHPPLPDVPLPTSHPVVSKFSLPPDSTADGTRNKASKSTPKPPTPQQKTFSLHTNDTNDDIKTVQTATVRSSRWDSRPSNNNDLLSSTTITAPDDTDRQWYMGQHDDSNDDPKIEIISANDETLAARRQIRNLSARAAANMADTARWESNQLASGLHNNSNNTNNNNSLIDMDESGPRVALLVNETTPKFLVNHDDDMLKKKQGGVVLGDSVVWPVKDVTSDMAVIARNGSATVSAFRENRERGKPRVKYWDLGSHTGAKDMENALMDAELEAKAASKKQEDKEDWKKDMRFSSAINNKREDNNKKFDEENKLNEKRGKSISKTRRSLPVFSVRRKLINVIREHQVSIVVGETGSGKTTQLAQYLAEEGYGEFGMIGCTQPRRVAAVSVAQRVADEYQGGVKLGEQVGYTIRFEDCTSEKTVIKFMTDGILMRESLGDMELDRYSVIIMDEAHERSLNTDVLFGILRGIVAKRRDLKVVITSATMNAEKFSSFFGNAPIFHIPGRTFPVDIFYSRTPVEDYVQAAVFQAVQLHIQAPLPGDILIFMTGQEDIEATCETLADEIGKRHNPRPILIVPIYSQLAADMQAKIFDTAPADTRKVVVATNIAETSVTIHGIQYVIDSGYCKLKTYNPRLGMDALLLCPAAQASVNQRAGRAGRTGPGKCYRLYTNAAYNSELLDSNVPEIQRTNLSHVVLLLKTLGVENVLDFPFLDPPPRVNILGSMHGLWLLGALDMNGMVTELGKRMASFPLDPALSALIFIGEHNNCLVEAVTIVAMLSVPNAFLRPHGREEESDSAREKFFIPESDHLTLLHVYQRWRAAGCRADWCARNYINAKSMRKAREVREQLLDIGRSQRMKETSCDEWDDIRRTIAQAFFYQAARRKGIGEYVNVRSGVVCGLHPTCAMYGSGLSPDFVVYHELIMTKKEYMSCVTAVEPQWLAEAGPMLYMLKKAGE